MPDATLEGKSVIVTGAGRGLGRAMTLGLAKAGATVTMVELDGDVLSETAAEVERAAGQGCVLPLSADVTSEVDAARVVDQAIERFSRVTGIINNAAVGPQFFYKTNTKPRPPIWEAGLDFWRRTVEVNANGPFIMTMAVLPHLFDAGWGRIVNVTTSLETMINAGMGPYGPAKACAEAFTSMLSQELDGTGVTANVLVPGGPADTRMIPPDGNREDRTRLIQPDVMVAPAAWLCSEASDGVNGQRFLAALFDPALPPEQAAETAGAPAAWPQMRGQAIRPPGDLEGR